MSRTLPPAQSSSSGKSVCRRTGSRVEGVTLGIEELKKLGAYSSGPPGFVNVTRKTRKGGTRDCHEKELTSGQSRESRAECRVSPARENRDARRISFAAGASENAKPATRQAARIAGGGSV